MANLKPSTLKRKLSCSDSDQEDEDEVERANYSDEEGGLRIDDIYIPPPIKATCSNHTNGPRLIITKIENEFFKSYAKKTILGPFHQSFNSIVGSNGSGKSNVIDSMLFVFGYRASKIRSKKLSVLLHNSETYRNVSSCTVSVHFASIIDKDDDCYDLVPGSEFIISRTANKDNSSFYQLNDKRVQFKEVAQVLRKNGVDLDHNRFLILQGEVEQIALMKCKAQNEHESGMLEYLEDIIGTSRYKEPLKKLEERVETLGEQRCEKLNRVKLIQKELDDLREPMKEAVGFLKTENSIISYKNTLYQKNVYELTKEMVDVEKEKKDIESTLNEFTEKLNTLKEEVKTKNALLKEESGKYEILKAKSDSLKETYNKATNRDEQLHADMTHINNTRKKTKELLSKERKKLLALERAPEENEKNITEYTAVEAKLANEREILEAKKAEMLPTLQNQTAELQERKEILANKLGELKIEVGKTKEAYALAESELKLYSNTEESEKEALKTLQTAYKTTVETIKERTGSISKLKKMIPLTEKSLKDATTELNHIKQQELQTSNKIREKRHYLEENRASMQASHSRSKVLDSLLQQKQNGNFLGVFGRLGDLGAIDKKYDVAVSTACGPLDNIVVDTVSTAQSCIEFLKQYDIGRATFIALEKQEHLKDRAKSTIITPENVPRLYDLIKINDERVKTAFYYALRDTLVADDLEQASRIAYGAQRYRVVTLRGDLIETTGTMSGGGKTVSKGRMGQSIATTNVQPEELERIEIELQELERSLGDLRQRQKKLEEQINTIQPELHRMQIDFEKFNMELKSSKQNEPQLLEKIEYQKTKVKDCEADPIKVKKLQKNVSSKKAEFDEALAKANKVQAKVDELTKEIKEKTYGKLRAIEKNISDVVKKHDKCKKEINKMKIAIKTAERDSEVCTENIARMEQDILKAEEKLKAMKAEREQIEVDGAQLLKSVETITYKLTEGEEEFASIKNEVKQLTNKENKLKSDKIEVDEKFKTVNKKISAIQVNIHQLKAKLPKLKLHDIPEEKVDDLKTYTDEDLSKMKAENIQRELQYAEEQLKSSKPNLNAIREYEKQRDIYIERSKELEDLSKKKADMKNMYDTVKTKRKDEFIAGYNIIKLKLKEMYQMITLGGDADFEMVDTYDPFTEGIQFNVRPPKKSWKNISNLSGGEKTLSSLALVFALHYYKPSPLYVMDEIDAALDFKNVSIVGNYIKERTKNAQFIIISLRSNMFELSNRLVGIYKTFNCTKSLVIDPNAFGNNVQENNEKNSTNSALRERNEEQFENIRNGDVSESSFESDKENQNDYTGEVIDESDMDLD